jgi:hypothetical protein
LIYLRKLQNCKAFVEENYTGLCKKYYLNEREQFFVTVLSEGMEINQIGHDGTFFMNAVRPRTGKFGPKKIMN